MYITHLKLQNWRNFRDLDISLRERNYLLGPNASGKSNLLDVFRFLRDVSKSQGGGLQKAIADRGGIQKLRCLHARRPPEVRIEVSLAESPDAPPKWRYILAFKPEGKGAQRTLITDEQVWEDGKQLFKRPNKQDSADPIQLTQTQIEQIQLNAKFREIPNHFSETNYLHLVPQLLKYNDRIGGNLIDDDPFGQGFLERVAKCSPKTRESRLRKIESALTLAVPKFKHLRFVKDEITGRPHLEAQYAHHRPNAGWQREEQFSDGTLRLLGLFWSLLENDSLLLLEEPELSLNGSIVKEIPLVIQKVLRDKKKKRQIIISTHSHALLSNPGIDGRGIIILEPVMEGTHARSITAEEETALKCGFSVAEVILPKIRPDGAEQLGFSL
ncbi:MAG: AAA family ATPase [Pseudomonas sp.]|uniref:AAA family ATPase n=1 Tax=Pseudomonas sp. TaxID=306 RepID=UPI002717ADF6|nr:ATP-binding protein [Pseudomonas sp.]MDO9618643.1 AAA family ATPase [Pseudomonas sp.]MDP2447512.1 AAA family ATPase [Pseudomonas sp.]